MLGHGPLFREWLGGLLLLCDAHVLERSLLGLADGFGPGLGFGVGLFLLDANPFVVARLALGFLCGIRLGLGLGCAPGLGLGAGLGVDGCHDVVQHDVAHIGCLCREEARDLFLGRLCGRPFGLEELLLDPIANQLAQQVVDDVMSGRDPGSLLHCHLVSDVFVVEKVLGRREVNLLVVFRIEGLARVLEPICHAQRESVLPVVHKHDKTVASDLLDAAVDLCRQFERSCLNLRWFNFLTSHFQEHIVVSDLLRGCNGAKVDEG